MGTKSSTARLSFTTTMSGRSARRRQSTSNRALAVGVRPETRVRPVPSRRWEATRAKAESFSTSAKSSRTKGSSMQDYFNRSLVERAWWAAKGERVRTESSVEEKAFSLRLVERARRPFPHNHFFILAAVDV